MDQNNLMDKILQATGKRFSPSISRMKKPQIPKSTQHANLSNRNPAKSPFAERDPDDNSIQKDAASGQLFRYDPNRRQQHRNRA